MFDFFRKKFFNKKEISVAETKEVELVGDNLSFEAVEAFNLLRTNVTFSFSDSKKCHVIGVTSAIPSTGKSLISANLAYSIAKTNKKVLLIDGDLRLPTINKKLNLSQKPGLSNILVDGLNFKEVVQSYKGILDVLSAGDVPPNPSELLGSEAFGNLLNEVAKNYDYIIIDLTPINIVSDGLVLVKFIDGFILAIRKDHDSKPIVKEAFRQLEIAKAKVIGLVFNNGKTEKNAEVNGR